MEEFKSSDLNGNENDPLKTKSDAAAKELLTRFAAEANGFPNGAVALACANILINIVRQKCATAKLAEQEFDMLSAGMKAMLLDNHYFPSGGRRNVYPHAQVISPEVIRNKHKVGLS